MENLKKEFMSETHRSFLENAVSILQADESIIGIAIGGSFILKSMDEYSDLDLVIAVDPRGFEEIMRERKHIASRLGKLAAVFTGEHVGEPRLLICLYYDPVLHVDLKFVSLPDAAVRVEDPAILFDRDGCFSTVLGIGEAKYPDPDLQWIEERFWVWVHYAATKIGRGELFEVIDFLSFLRITVLGPLSLKEAGARPSGVRKIELLAPERAKAMKKTIVKHNRRSCIKGLMSAITIYVSLRESLRHENFTVNAGAEHVAMKYLLGINTK